MLCSRMTRTTIRHSVNTAGDSPLPVCGLKYRLSDCWMPFEVSSLLVSCVEINARCYSLTFKGDVSLSLYVVCCTRSDIMDT